MKRLAKVLGMTFILMLTLSTISAVSVGAGSRPTNRQTTTVTTHPSQGPVTEIDGARAHLVSNKDGITVLMRTKELEYLHANTLWFVTINRPDLCLTSPCSSEDILKRTDIVKANVVYGNGRIVRSGMTSFMAYVPTGPVEGGWFENDLTNPMGAEVHLVINDHGMIIPGMEREMTKTYRAGCTDASIPVAFPPAAYADGTPGPNACRLVQVAIFKQ